MTTPEPHLPASFEARALEVDGFPFHYTAHEGDRWWTLRDLVRVGLPLRTNQFDDGDVLDVRPKMVREEALRSWAKQTRSDTGPRLQSWLGTIQQALLGFDVEGDIDWLRTRAESSKVHRAPSSKPALEERYETLDVGQTPPAPPAKEDEEGSHQYETIDWTTFVYEGDEVRGISLRAMVEAGLYEQMGHAVRALRRANLSFSPVQEESSGGRPSTDYVLTLQDAKRFAARARTEVGLRILDVIIEHHDEFQRVLSGDPEATARVREHRRASSAPAEDPLLAQLEAMARMRREALAREARLEAVEASLGALEEERRRRLADRENRALAPEPEVGPAELPLRARVNRLVRGWAYEHGGDYQAAYNELYREYRDRYHTDLKARAAHAGAGVGALDIAEQLGVLEEVYAVTHELYAPRPTTGAPGRK